MSTWTAQVAYQIDCVRAEITDFTAWLDTTDADETERASMLAPWRTLLAALEGPETERARAMDAETGGGA